MAIIVVELRRSKARTSSGQPTDQRVYMAWDNNDATPDPDAVEAAVEAVAPDAIGSLVVTNYRQEPQEGHQGVLLCTVDYGKVGKRETVETGESEYSFEIGQQSAHVLHSLQTISSYGDEPEDFKQAIGWNGERFDGAEINVPTYDWRETHYIPIESVTAAYKAAIFQCVANPVNADSFRGFSPGEVLIRGASGAPRSAEDFALNLAFSASPNVTGLSIGDVTGISKKGWEYLWVLFEKKQGDKRIIEVPKSVYIEKVYGSSNFTTLLGV